ncbi:gamma-glutamylcyclotransferase [Bradyrhizobium sp. 2]|uniref:gamma-glutamylcyclotransferase n=1 Tax=Bradyrhizobium sp. 2 TaxID=190045 RepID=UPI001FFA73F4|nr:gamma-glutamylcyclotransferase [Bradyrhizobium sp. 2]MCK1463078.1 gamma-glutamylcyclotransferase [Bradyrhizobium sp. 2]
MTFWVFAYGSLMADGWETTYRCTSRSAALLRGYSRAFDKASIESRGTREHPAPTLRVVASNGECHGVAFGFDDEQRAAILADLMKREGKTFPLREKTVHLPNGMPIKAMVPEYEGRHIIVHDNLRTLAQMAIKARGTRGNGIDYVRDVAKHLDAAGVKDKVVTDFLDEIETCLREVAENK